MDATIPNQSTRANEGSVEKPLNASYGKMMMWFFLVSDALTFSGFLGAYGLMRYKFIDTWPIADEVFTHVPFTHTPMPMIYVAFMTFVLIFSSVTMVLAVDAGHQMNKKKVTLYMLLTIIGGLIFLGSQAWEWKHFINGDKGAIQLNNGEIIQFVKKDATGIYHQVSLESFASHTNNERVQHTKSNGLWFKKEAGVAPISLEQVLEGFKKHPELALKTEQIDLKLREKIVVTGNEATKLLANSKQVVIGANLKVNEYGKTLFGDFFFFITGFHGFHVLSGILINIIIFFNVILGTYERRGHYEMVEKVGLYWHFVDLVWVFVFTFFYLV
ncbi:MAG: cytochrome c oxidase subunit 3 [Flavobacteriaceae bacterium]|nr:cytochrome c oxidase subunit 3 [Flavobacteriaceae bacterium]